jgi:hypothetical protein
MKGSSIFYPIESGRTVDDIARELLITALIELDEKNENLTSYYDLLMGDIPNQRLITWFNNRFLTKEICQKWVDQLYKTLEYDDEDQTDMRRAQDIRFIHKIIKLDLIKLEAKIKAEYL